MIQEIKKRKVLIITDIVANLHDDTGDWLPILFRNKKLAIEDHNESLAHSKKMKYIGRPCKIIIELGEE